MNIVVKLGQGMVEMFWQSCEVKRFVVHLLEKYAASTDNDVDNMAVSLIRTKLLVNCPEK
jgi:hypothetical protein